MIDKDMKIEDVLFQKRCEFISDFRICTDVAILAEPAA